MDLGFLDRIVSSIEEGNILVSVIIVVVAIIFNYKKIADYLEERKRARILKISEALGCEHVEGLTKEHLKEELATEHFKIATGLRLEKEFREAIISLHKKTKGNLGFFHFKRAMPHLEYKYSNLKVNLTRFDKAGFWFNLVFGCILTFLGLMTFVVPAQIDKIRIVQIFIFIGLGALFFTIGLMMLTQTFPVRSAKLIQEEMKSLTKS
ncbi:hypothetical protein [Alteromonas halophila]|uniref:Uncharacterized protein n=1 Tax=Alteromonas halophila TaxID=516698 RepID=A0A918JQ55_9ALTE|nr:hypothetical protein [Alteromonas halophila]GGW96688.1 hypothetical protein GCM10007391_33520 [Alteromonas halophila]